MKLKKIFSKLKTYILSSPKLLLGLILLFIIVLLVCAAPFLTSYSPTHLSDDLLVPPLTKGHFLGTTNMGEDVWSQILYGGRVSLKIGIVAAILSGIIGVIFGVGFGGIHTFEEEVLGYAQTKDTIGPKFSPFFIPKMIADIASGQISIMYGFHGPNFTTTSACASSSNAIADAFNYIRLGKANVIVAGGAEAAIFPAGVGGFNAMHALSTRNDDPQHASRPFSASRDGFIMGEGAGCLILEELEHAKARGAKIYAELAGVGASADAHHLTASHPEGLGAKLVMLNALEDAEMKPEDIDYINVHGTSTPVGDVSEAKAIKDVFGEHAYKLNISSTKSMTGHLLGAAGAVEAIASVLAVKNDIVPPTINHAEGDNDENIDYELNFTFNKAQKRTVNAALSNTFGFGGHNACVIVKKYAE